MKRLRNYGAGSRLVLAAAIAGNLLALPLAIQAETYYYTDLHPGGLAYSQGSGISGSQQVGGYSPYATGSHALLWSGTAGSVVDLHPSGFVDSWATGNLGNQQVGYGTEFYGYVSHALLWSGMASSVVDLHPSEYIASACAAISGSQQVGWGYGATNDYIATNRHALLWSGTASSVVDLHPSGYIESRALGIGGAQQVGWGSSTSDRNHHALLWSGTANSVVDLTPSGVFAAEAWATSGSQQVGQRNGHAFLWSGTPSSAVDLHPSGLTLGSIASAISGNQQVGWGGGSATGNRTHAFLWSGTASSAVDLHNFLSSDYSDSLALGIDANGNIIGYAHYIPTDRDHAILWAVIPQLAITQSGQNMVLSWPSSAPGFTLQSALSLKPPINWIDFTNAIAIVGTQNVVTNTVSNTFQFYRLKK